MINNSFSEKYEFTSDSCQPGVRLLLINRREMSEWVRAGVGRGSEAGSGESGHPSAAVHRPPRSYENLIVSHTKANWLSILRDRLFLSSKTAERFARVAPASFQLPPSVVLSFPRARFALRRYPFAFALSPLFF